jgi:DNA-directed RNA polymerase specialized sigma24 family protein
MKTFDSSIGADSHQAMTHSQPKQIQITTAAAKPGGPRLTEIPDSSHPLSFEALYVQYLPQAVALAWRRGAHDPENVAQEAMLKAMKTFDPNRGEFGAYLYYAVRSCGREEARHRGKLNTVPLTDEMLELPAEVESSCADSVPKLLAGLAKLRPLDRELLRQRFWLGRTIEEIIKLPEYRQ